MTHFTIAICTWWVSVAGFAVAQSPAGASAAEKEKPPVVKTVAAPSKGVETLPPAPVSAPAAAPAPVPPPAPAISPVSPVSPGEAPMTREARAHEQYLLQSQAQAESIRRAAIARADQRTRRLESQRWFGISNSRPMANVDPYNGDYSPGWVSNYPYYPMRWVGIGEPLGIDGQ